MPLINVVQVVVPPNVRQYYKTQLRGIAGDVERDLLPIFKEIMKDWLADVVDEAIATTRLKKRSGSLFRDLQSKIRVAGSNFANIIGSIRSEPYGSLHEYGGVITPVRAKALALPLDDALRPDGSPKRLGPDSWRGFGTFIYKSKKTGQAYIVYRRGGRMVFLYVLVKKARFEAKLGLRRAISKLMPLIEIAWGEAYATYVAQNFDFFAEFVDGSTKKSNAVFSAFRRIGTSVRVFRR